MFAAVRPQSGMGLGAGIQFPVADMPAHMQLDWSYRAMTHSAMWLTVDALGRWLQVARREVGLTAVAVAAQLGGRRPAWAAQGKAAWEAQAQAARRLLAGARRRNSTNRRSSRRRVCWR